MSLLSLAVAFLFRRWGQALLSVLVGALAICAVESMLIAEREIPKAAQRAFGGVDLVIGPKGSALDLVLCCVLHASEPRGLIPLEAGLAAARHPLIKNAAPIALGDTIQGVRIAGTTPEILAVYGATLAKGEIWSQPMQAVLGAQAARALKMKIGDSFAGSHGLGDGGEEHEEFHYRVTGILAPTGSALDRLVLTSLESVFEVHHHHETEEAEAAGEPPHDEPHEATAVLVSFRSPVALAMLPRLIDEMPQFSAASPAMETARLARAGRPVIMAVMGLGVLFAAIAAATAATALTAAMNARARDLALLRALGAHPWEIGAIAAVEAGLLAAGAVVLGLALSLGLTHLAAGFLAAREGLAIDVVPAGSDLVLIGLGAIMATIMGAAVPAYRAARYPIEKVMFA